MKRRQFLVHSARLAVGAPLAMPLLAAAQSARVDIAPLAQFKADWDDAPFNFGTEPCVVVRVPKPRKEDEARMLEVNAVWFSAYSRTCTHVGCIAQLPNGERKLECGCHGSVFDAAGGAVVTGPAQRPLRAVRLTVDGGRLFAVGWLEPSSA